MSEAESLVVFAPLAVEAIALRAGARELRIERIGHGPAPRARGGRSATIPTSARALAVAGVCGALDPALAPGDVFVPAELRTDDGALVRAPTRRASPTRCARAGSRRTRACWSAPTTSCAPTERPALFASGARAVDMESPWLAAAAAGRPFAVLRVVSDGPGAELWSPSHPAQTAGARSRRCAAPRPRSPTGRAHERCTEVT